MPFISYCINYLTSFTFGHYNAHEINEVRQLANIFVIFRLFTQTSLSVLKLSGILGLSKQIQKLPAQRKFVSMKCHAHSKALRQVVYKSLPAG